MQVIAEAVGYQPSFWDFLGRLFGVVVEGIAGGLQTIVTVAEGIRMQFIGTLTVEVMSVAPECPTSDVVEQTVRNDNPGYRDLSG